MAVRIGVLSLQGNFSRHQERLAEFGLVSAQIKQPADLRQLSGLILPGGESSTMLTLLSAELKQALCDEISAGLPVLATCAGAILIARRVENPLQESLNLINVDIRRNAYGRQINSFVAPLSWSATLSGEKKEPVEGVFIRAPKFSRIGDNVDTLLLHESDPVLVRYKNILAATFHPELSEKAHCVHRLFLNQIDRSGRS